MEIIKIKPRDNGDVIIRLYGTDYKIVIDKADDNDKPADKVADDKPVAKPKKKKEAK